MDELIGLTERGEMMAPSGNSLLSVKEERMISGQDTNAYDVAKGGFASLRKGI